MKAQLTPALMAKPLGAVFVLAGFVGLVAGLHAGFAALMGGLIAWLSQVCFAKGLLRAMAQGCNKTFMRAFYRAEVRKFGLTALLFIPAITLAHAPGIPLLASYAIIQVSWMLWLLRQARSSLFELSA